MSKYEPYCSQYHQAIDVDAKCFDQITKHLISGCTDKVKYLCCNEMETLYLQKILMQFNPDIRLEAIYDWWKINKVVDIHSS